jgi:hypothetical protein
MMRRAVVVGITVLAALALGGGSARADRVSVTASYVPPPKAGANGAVSVTFATGDPDVRVNRDPAPRLTLDADQRVLVDKQPPRARRGGSADVEAAGFFEPGTAVTFPVALGPAAKSGRHDVDGVVTYFYCSKRDGWCRKGTAEIDIPVSVP